MTNGVRPLGHTEIELLGETRLDELLKYAGETSAHECGHIVVLFEQGRFVNFNFLPRETAADGNNGVFEVNTGIQNGPQDCVILAGGMAGEKVALGREQSEHIAHDESEVRRLVGRPLQDFVPEAEEIIRRNLRFFNQLSTEIFARITDLLLRIYHLDWSTLDAEIPIITPAEVEQIYRRAAGLK
jgi:hypothetical protein